MTLLSLGAALLAGWRGVKMKRWHGLACWRGLVMVSLHLSGGQRQRLSIARAFLKDAPILILDEPTSALDSQTEQALLVCMRELMLGRTTFIIAHRLSTVRQANTIVVLDRGRIVEQGSHDELLQQDALYARMYRAQWDDPNEQVLMDETVSEMSYTHEK